MHKPDELHCLWPVRVQPELGELLSSWMIRLAHAHGMRAQSLATAAFSSRWPMWNRDIDRSASPELLVRLSMLSGVGEQSLRQCTLDAFNGILTEDVRGDGGHVRGLLPLGVYHRTRTRRALMYCAACLNADPTPYFRQSWRVSYLTVCPRHHTLLRDACVACGAIVIPHRVDRTWRQQTTLGSTLHIRCWRCGEDLRFAPNDEATEADIAMCVRINRARETGGEQIGKHWVYAPAFFDGLRPLTMVWAKHAPGAALSGSAWLEKTPLEERRKMLAGIEPWLADWPEAFVRFAVDHKVVASTLSRRHDPQPFWIDEVVRVRLLKRHARIDVLEAQAIVDFTERQSSLASLTTARKVSGRNVDTMHLPAARWADVSHSAYELLLAHIDGLVAGEADQTERFHLLADKVLFALARVLGFPQSRIHTLTTRDLAALANDQRPDFWEIPATSDQLGAWLNWYLEQVRPKLIRSDDLDFAFVCRDGRRKLSRSAICARFCHHVRAAALEKEIKSFAHFRTCGERKARVLIDISAIGNGQVHQD